jgi:hypothetical protein
LPADILADLGEGELEDECDADDNISEDVPYMSLG